MTSNKKRVRLSDIIGPAFYETHKLIDMGVIDEAVESGGRASLKSSYVGTEVVLQLVKHPDCHALVTRQVGDTMRDSVYAQILWAIDKLGLTTKFKCTQSPLQCTYLPTGQRILFRGLDDPQKIKSIKLPFGKYFKYVWFEELDEFAGEGEIENVLDSAIRGGKAALCVCTYNPPKSANNWVNKWAIDPGKSVFVHHSDYTMVPAAWLGPTFIKRAEELKVRNPRAYEHTYLGIATGEGGAVFKALRIKPIAKEDRLRFELKPNIGMDFGYVDPNAIEKTYYEAGELRTLYIYEEVYQNEMTTKQIAAACKKIARHGELIRADNAAKQVIVDLRTDYGINITGVTKGKNSRQAGYDWLRDLDQIVIDPITCPNAAREFAAYEYARDKSGTLVERYPDGDDHSIDAVAYGNREHIYRSKRTSNVSGKGARR